MTCTEPHLRDVARLHLQPGDALVIWMGSECQISQHQAVTARDRVRSVLGRPDLPVIVLGAHDSIEAVALPEHAE